MKTYTSSLAALLAVAAAIVAGPADFAQAGTISSHASQRGRVAMKKLRSAELAYVICPTSGGSGLPRFGIREHCPPQPPVV
jgi:hypothetical protein